MKKIRTIGLALAILVALGAGNVVYAASPANPVSTGDPIQSKNPQNKGLKSPHSARKEAAKRLKPVYQKEHQQKLQDWVKQHKVQKGQGQKSQGQSQGQTGGVL